MKFMKYVMLGLLALGVQSSVEASARSSRFPASPPPSMIGSADDRVAAARKGGGQGLGLDREGPNKYVSPFSSHQVSAPTLQHERATTDPHHPDHLGVGDPTAAILGKRSSTSKKDTAYVSPFSSHQGSAPTLQHERATTDPHHPDHLRIGDPTAAILGRKLSSSNLPKYEHRVSHTPIAAQVQQSPQRPSFFSNFRSNVQNVRGILQPSYKAKQEVKQAKNRTMSLGYERDQIHAQIKSEGNPDPKTDPRWQAAQKKVLAAKLEENLKISLASKLISKQDLQAIQSHGASVDLQRQRLDNLRNIRINNQKIDRLKDTMKKGAKTPEEAEKLMKDMSDAIADDKKYHNENRQLFAPPAKPAAASMPAPVVPAKPVAPARETAEQARGHVAR